MSEELNPHNPEAVNYLSKIASKDLNIADSFLPEDHTTREAWNQLYGVVLERIQELIDTDFEALLLLLYRTDVSEERLKHLLDANPPDKAPEIIAQMFIARQLQKFETRKKFSSDSDSGSSWEDDL